MSPKIARWMAAVAMPWPSVFSTALAEEASFVDLFAPERAVDDFVGDLQVVSQCKPNLDSLEHCTERLAAVEGCSMAELINNSFVRNFLDCGDSEVDCQSKCLDKLGSFGVNVSAQNSQCTLEQQLMKAYSGSPRMLIDVQKDDTGMLRPKIVPAMLAEQAAGGTPSMFLLGEYDRCLHGSGMKYCLLEGHISLKVGNAKGKKAPGLVGLCRPQSCTRDDIDEHIRPMISRLGLENYTLDCHALTDPSPPVLWTQEKQIAFAIFVLVAALVVLGTASELQAAGTHARLREATADGEPAAREVAPRGGWARRALTAARSWVQDWSLKTNLESFSRVRTAKAGSALYMDQLDGLRVVSTLWVILGHTLIWPMASVQYENMSLLLPPKGRIAEVWFQFVPGGYFAVDTFFFLSGFLGARSLQAKVARSPSLLTAKGFCLRLYPACLLARWLRLTGIYAFIMMFTQTWYRELGSGSLLWNSFTTPGSMGCVGSIDNAVCKKYWWASLLYLNNLIPKDQSNGFQGCMAWTWYLACDMQLFLLLPFVVLIRARVGARAGWAVVSVLCLASMVANAVMIYTEKMVTDPMLAGMGGGNFWGKVYEVSWMRAQPYFVGIASVWVLEALLAGRGLDKSGFSVSSRGVADQELGERFLSSAGPTALSQECDQMSARTVSSRRTRNTVVALFLQLLAFALMCLVVFLPAGRYACSSFSACLSVDTSPWSEGMNAAYGALNHFVWAVGLAMLLILCFIRSPGTWWINTLLGAELWQKVGKLTYTAYLIHPLVLVFFYCQQTKSMQYLDSAFFGSFITFACLSFVGAFFLWLCVEKPLARVSARFLSAIGVGAGSME